MSLDGYITIAIQLVGMSIGTFISQARAAVLHPFIWCVFLHHLSGRVQANVQLVPLISCLNEATYAILDTVIYLVSSDCIMCFPYKEKVYPRNPCFNKIVPMDMF